MALAGDPATDGAAAPGSEAGLVSAADARSVLAGAALLIPVAVTVHYANEYADVDTDGITDRTPFSGGSGALVETGLQRSILRNATVGALLVTLAAASWVVAAASLPPDAVALAVAILVAGLAYSLSPVALVRRGVGEVVNAVLGGVLLPLYGVAVVGTPTLGTVLAVLPFTLVVGCNLLATHWPDRVADARVGKRTLAVRWSPGRLRRAYALLATAAGTVTVVLWWGNALPDVVAVAHLVAVPPLVAGWRTLARHRSPLPAVLAMVSLALASTVAWWLLAIEG